MQTSNTNIQHLVRDIRKRWRRRALLQGAALTLLALLFFASILLLLYTALQAPPPYLTAVGLAGAAVVLGLLVQFVLRPAFRRISDRQIALFVEEKIPELEDRLNSAIELDGGDRRRRDALLDRLVDDAVRRTRAIPLTTVIDQKRERLLVYGAGCGLLLFLLFGYSTLRSLDLSSAGMAVAALTAPQPLLTVEPGSIEIEKGASQEIIVRLREDADHPVTLHYRMGEGPWQKADMQRGLSEPVYLHEFLDVQENVQYFAQYDEHRSDPYLLSLYEFPEVDRIDLTYTYPAYTGRSPRREEDARDIYGLEGSTVTVDLTATGTTKAAELVLDDEKTVPLRPLGEGRFRGTITLAEPGFYSVRLTDEQNKHNKFPEEYQITPVEDEKPRIAIEDPQRDVRANAIEEVLLAVRVQDDYGVKDVRLRYSVNGQAEQTLRLMAPEEARAEEVAGEHLFFLEDYSLEPGDVISYYVEAEDYYGRPAPEATDMYFIEVIPFDQQYAQAANMGGMGGGQPSGIVVSQQQIIAATWKLHRERAEMEPEAFREALKGLVQAQNNLKSNIEQRINGTAFSLELRMSEENRQIVDLLREAVGAMDEALVELGPGRLQEALTPERKALNHLLKADALNKEKQVALSRQPGAGSGSSATEERMTELMDLELDISKDKYEIQQSSPQAQQQQQVDDALQKVRELARRQQNLMNQSQREALQGEDKKRLVDRLKRDQDELRSQTESLSNAMRQLSRENPQVGSQSAQQMERISRQMREAEQALRSGDVERAMARQQQALNELNRLQEDLRMASTDNAREALDELARGFEQLQNQEEQLARDLGKAAARTRDRQGRLDREELDALREKRQQVLDNLTRMTHQAEALQERARQSDPELATAARNLRQQLEREELEEMMRDAKRALDQGWMDRASRLEEEIQASLGRVGEEVRGMQGRLPAGDEEKMARALEDVRDLMQQMEQLQSQAESGSAPGGQPGRAEAARMQRQLERARETLGRLQEQLGGMPGMQARLQQMGNYLARADHIGDLLEGERAKQYFNERVYDPLSQLEMELSRQMDEIALEKKLYGARKHDVPTEYRTIVEKYYESLAKTRDR